MRILACLMSGPLLGRALLMPNPDDYYLVGNSPVRRWGFKGDGRLCDATPTNRLAPP